MLYKLSVTLMLDLGVVLVASELKTAGVSR